MELVKSLAEFEGSPRHRASACLLGEYRRSEIFPVVIEPVPGMKHIRRPKDVTDFVASAGEETATAAGSTWTSY